jgi:hypothetical protein
VTRFKELERIEAAIEREDRPELLWSLDYTQMRVRISPNARQEKYWQDMERKLKSALQRAADAK